MIFMRPASEENTFVRRRTFMSLRITCLLIFLLIFVSSVFPQKTDKHQKTKKSANCDPSLWDHVWKPKRLRVLKECVIVSGIVESKKEEDDGDVHMLLLPDDAYKKMLNKQNVKLREGCLVVEVICAGRIKNEEATEPCEGYSNKISIPEKDAHVWVTGAFVCDKHNGWNEIHPVSEIKPY
jgi:hypothetical protein